jgi:hypothetical protein
VGPVDLTLRQAFGAIKIGIRQIRVVEPCQPQIRAAQIGTTERGSNEECATQPCIAEVGRV